MEDFVDVVDTVFIDVDGKVGGKLLCKRGSDTLLACFVGSIVDECIEAVMGGVFWLAYLGELWSVFVEY